MQARSLARESGDQGIPKTVSDDSSRGHENAIKACHFNFKFWNNNPVIDGELILGSVILFIFHI